ncbi:MULTISPECIES: BlaI/MecI/CopY family transcriptional regulator [unclassified Lentimicrobium]|uniref:BlaI/MecI/CopY family transcriptional regulator n=1 Tax=unclassified Lentimicrobium TaxID=2677434 RepID=UPI0015568182|nr:MULTISPECIES: BlaI/MecI/CopY family transcriptional regulator [unclassified Lentimicrobium]NPD46654.1 BlaI/MecI/CopY family transcriptional regulator [Lentimicrobium sp. S6]NPD85479.1 BlaI/MecI/CopY family transcriptional regulator [Lentimicrobium sp. L6]
MESKRLTKAEEEIMQILWDLEEAFVNEIIEKFPEPKPAYNTVSTIVRILVKKKFVAHKAFGKSHQYYPLMSKKEYADKYFSNFVQNYFSNSYQSLVSFLTRQEKLDLKDMEAIRAMMDAEINKQKGGDDE